jgi:hypothetical protein
MNNPPKFCLLVFTDGRDYIWETVQSFEAAIKDKFDYVFINDDSDSHAYRMRLHKHFNSFGGTPAAINSNPRRLGFAHNIAEAWKRIPPDVDYCFHLEDDFVAKKMIDIEEMAEVMNENPHLVQIALMRQPWSSEEKKYGGIVGYRSAQGVEFTEKSQEIMLRNKPWLSHWYEHAGWLTTNPCLYPKWVADRGWPTDEGAGEGKMFRLLHEEDPRRRSAYWGRIADEPWVWHIGYGRNGYGY